MGLWRRWQGGSRDKIRTQTGSQRGWSVERREGSRATLRVNLRSQDPSPCAWPSGCREKLGRSSPWGMISLKLGQQERGAQGAQAAPPRAWA